jgi:hypothetical protein
MPVLIVTPASKAIRDLFAARRPLPYEPGKKDRTILFV